MVDAFRFARYDGGTELRHLVYGFGLNRHEERIWDVVEGQPEAWEHLLYDPSETPIVGSDEPFVETSSIVYDLLPVLDLFDHADTSRVVRPPIWQRLRDLVSP